MMMRFDTIRAPVVMLAGLLLCAPAFADKPEWAGAGKGKGKDTPRSEQAQRGSRARAHFDERHKTVVREYYVTEYRRGHCPPGLAKKHNGCMPPGQARKWRIGRPLPREVIFHDLPPALVVEIGVPPAGHRYVRVASDILLIAIGTGMVVDAIEDIGRM